MTESFEYDSRNRLASSEVENQNPGNLSYDSRGNITAKTGIGTFDYNGVRINQLENITPDTLYKQNHNQSLTYNSDNLTTTVNQEDTLVLQILYNPMNQRIKSTLLNNGDTTRIKYYSGNYEKKIEGSEVRQFNYIYCPYGLIAVNIDFGESDTTYYVETDHLGSIIGLLRPDGSYVEKYSYDAWGRQRNPVTWTYDSIPRPTIIDRGYTGHEHLDEFDLINMNGRIYDPYVGRFLSVDPVIQFTGNSQSFNGYSYCLNNPVIYIDPSGYLFNKPDKKRKKSHVRRECNNTNQEDPHDDDFAEFLSNFCDGLLGAFDGGGNGYSPSGSSLMGYYYANGFSASINIISGADIGGGGGAKTFTVSDTDPSLQRGLPTEDRIVLIANRLAMKELGLNPDDVQSYGPSSSLYSKLSKLNNPQIYTKGWSKTLNSSSGKFDARISSEIGNTGFALKYYPTKNGFNDALGLVRTGEIGHFVETSLEIWEALSKMNQIKPDDWLYDMHLYNSILFINRIQ